MQIRAEGVHQLIERDIQRGHKDDLPEGLREHTELRRRRRPFAGFRRTGQLALSVHGHERLRSSTARRPSRGEPVDYLGNSVPLRIWSQKVSVGGQSYLIQSAFEMDDFYAALDHFALLLFISIPSLLVCAAAGGYWISTRALAPVDQITQTARTISAQNLSSRLVVPNTGDELQRLSETLNGMLERLEAAFKKITQFTADASHELRTPVAVMRTRAELVLAEGALRGRISGRHRRSSRRARKNFRVDRTADVPRQGR